MRKMEDNEYRYHGTFLPGGGVVCWENIVRLHWQYNIRDEYQHSYIFVM